MHTKSDNIEILMYSEWDEVTEELFESLLQSYQQELEEEMRGNEFIFDSDNFMHHHFQKISLNRGGSYIECPEWLKNKKPTINTKNNDDKCLQYASPVALDYKKKKKIKKEYQRSSIILISIIGKV